MSRYAFANAARYRMRPNAETLLRLDTETEVARLYDLAGGEGEAWEAFWATVPDDASALKVYRMVCAEVDRLRALQEVH
jgi:hypothetical protein